MTKLLEPQVEWLEKDDRGRVVVCVTTAKYVNPFGGWWLVGSEDYPEERAIHSGGRFLETVMTLIDDLARPEIAAFEKEHAAFLTLLPALESSLGGRFVAVHGETVVDSDVSRKELVRRFFARFGDVPVYIGFVGEPPIAYQVTPFQI